MKRFDASTSERVENPKVDAFLAEILDVCRRHGLSISHEDSHGGFLVTPFDESTAAWLNDASINIDPPKAPEPAAPVDPWKV